MRNLRTYKEGNFVSDLKSRERGRKAQLNNLAHCH